MKPNWNGFNELCFIWSECFASGFVNRGRERGLMHYRSGLNMIPLIEAYRANPDDLYLLQVALGKSIDWHKILSQLPILSLLCFRECDKYNEIPWTKREFFFFWLALLEF